MFRVHALVVAAELEFRFIHHAGKFLRHFFREGFEVEQGRDEFQFPEEEERRHKQEGQEIPIGHWWHHARGVARGKAGAWVVAK